MRQRLLTSVACSEFVKGTVVFHEGDPCEAIYLVLSGRCESLTSRPVHGRAHRTVYGPGDTLGGRALLSGEPHRSTITVVTASMLVRVPASELHHLFEKHPHIAVRFSQLVTGALPTVPVGEESPVVRRVAALLPLAPRADVPAVVQSLSKSLHGITGQRVLVIHLTPPGPDKAFLLDNWRAAPHLNGHFNFAEYLHTDPAGYHEVRLTIGPDPRHAATIAPLLSHCGRHYDYVLLHVAPDVPAPATLECLIQSDFAFVLLQPAEQSLYDFQLLMRELTARSPIACGTVHPVMLAEEGLAAPDFESALRSLGRPAHSVVRGFPLSVIPNTPDWRFGLAMNRLAREIAGRRIGLALSSGGAKGLAHIGVIQVLEENGIEVDCIAGSSMGAYVGSIWACGFDGAQLERIARENENRWNFLRLLQPALFPRQGFLRTGRIIRRLRQSVGNTRFSELVRPLRVVATHLETLERVVFSSGDVADAVAASIAIPGVAVPVTVQGDRLIDGGIADPLPVDVLHEMGIERVIAVNVIPPPAIMRQWLEAEAAQGLSPRRGGAVRQYLGDRLNWFAPGNIIHVMFQAISGGQTGVAEAAGREADVLLRPLSCDASWHDFRHPGKYIALGRAVAEAQLPALKAIAKGGPHETRISRMARRTPLIAS
jgi:NTE family protein